ncbi:hypothetical protein D3C78_1586970 [compost metagenome]
MITLHHHATAHQLLHGMAIDLGNREGIAIERNGLHTSKKRDTMLRASVPRKCIDRQMRANP